MTAPQDRNTFAEPEMPRGVPVKRGGSPTSRFIRPAVALLVVAVLGFGGGYVFANATSTPAASVRGNGQFGNGQFGPGASPGAGRTGTGGFGGGASGTVTAVSADQMTITTAAGAQRLVLLTPTTAVTEVTSATKALSDIANGATVTIIGTANQDGSVTATQVVIGSAGILGRGFDGGGVPTPTGAP
jgi:pectate lyase